MQKRSFLPPLLLVCCGLLLSYPRWRYGLTADGDAIFHSMWYTNFARQVCAGEWYPRWLLAMNGGLGSPVFFFYAPLPYYATLLFTPFLPAGPYGLAQLGAAAALALTASGLTTYLWLRQTTGAKPAVVGAIFYMLAPYHLSIDMYTRGAFAELWAFVWLPLTLYFIVLIRGRCPAALVGLALSYAALIMSHLPSTLLFSAIPPAYAFCCTVAEDRRRCIRLTLAGMLLGAGVAAIYLLPALTTQANISTVDFTASAYHERWLHFTGFKLDDLDAQLFWLTGLMMAIALCAFVAGRRNATTTVGRERLFWLLVALGCVFMMFPLLRPLWQLITTLQSVQFPWRFNVILCLATTALVTNGLATLVRPYGVLTLLTVAGGALLMLGCAYYAGYTVWRACPPGPQAALHEVFLKRAAQRRDAPEYRPVSAASIQEGAFEQLLAHICKTGAQPAQVCVVDGAGTAAVTRWRPREIALDVACTQGVSLNVSQFYYPGWQAEVDGNTYPLEPSKPDGLLHLSLPGGAHHVRLRLRQSQPELAGQIISGASVLLLALWMFVRAKSHSLLGSHRPRRAPVAEL